MISCKYAMETRRMYARESCMQLSTKGLPGLLASKSAKNLLKKFDLNTPPAEAISLSGKTMWSFLATRSLFWAQATSKLTISARSQIAELERSSLFFVPLGRDIEGSSEAPHFEGTLVPTRRDKKT